MIRAAMGWGAWVRSRSRSRSSSSGGGGAYGVLMGCLQQKGRHRAGPAMRRWDGADSTGAQEHSRRAAAPTYGERSQTPAEAQRRGQRRGQRRRPWHPHIAYVPGQHICTSITITAMASHRTPALQQ
ncbi:hypothetical protein BDZ91DRAFT_815388 [Kalaharituber pfeilii]|nr:hypothetical protein BDZ91DRAFT_815388 [Kalaharituber pfeilii]